MRTCAVLLAAAVVGLVGCQAGQVETAAPPPESVGWSQSQDGLTVRMSIPKRQYVRGQEVPVTLAATNASGQDVVLSADTQAQVIVTLARQTSQGWEEVKRFPTAVTRVSNRWTIGPGETFRQTLRLPVTADWPTAERLKLTAWLNGRPEVAPSGTIMVLAGQSGGATTHPGAQP